MWKQMSKLKRTETLNHIKLRITTYKCPGKYIEKSGLDKYQNRERQIRHNNS